MACYTVHSACNRQSALSRRVWSDAKQAPPKAVHSLNESNSKRNAQNSPLLDSLPRSSSDAEQVLPKAHPPKRIRQAEGLTNAPSRGASRTGNAEQVLPNVYAPFRGASRKGQVSAEAITAAIIVVLFMVGVLASNSYMAGQVAFLREDAAQANDCSRLVSAIILAGSTPGNAKIETTIRSDANISKNTISFGEAFCSFPGAQISANLAAGGVRVSKGSGVVSVENV